MFIPKPGQVRRYVTLPARNKKASQTAVLRMPPITRIRASRWRQRTVRSVFIRVNPCPIIVFAFFEVAVQPLLKGCGTIQIAVYKIGLNHCGVSSLQIQLAVYHHARQLKGGPNFGRTDFSFEHNLIIGRYEGGLAV